MYGQNLAKLWNDESGSSSVDYALLLVFIASGIIIAAELLSGAVENERNGTSACMEDTSGCIPYAFPPNTFTR